MVKRVIVLGATGSIGTTTLDVVRDFPDRFKVVGLSARSKIDLLARQAGEFRPAFICVSDAAAAEASGLRSGLGGDVLLLKGEAGVVELVRRCEADVLVVATVGFAGLLPTLAGVDRGMRIALANKEVLVAAGDVVVERARRGGVEILPIDSEHNAVLQCLAGNDRRSVRRVVLTASGGPFLRYSREALERVTVEQALRHPTWNMGRKITIDCATLMNKGLEVIEACRLFDLRPEQVEVVIHPESTIHSMVEFADGSILAQMGQTNMYLPILNVLSYPDRVANKFPPLDLVAVGALRFEQPDRERFPCLDYAYEAIRVGGTLPAAMNAANEVAVGVFLEGHIPFMGIAATIRAVMDRHDVIEHTDLDNLRETDRLAREMATEHARGLA